MASPTPLELALRQRDVQQGRMLENPGALAQGFANAPGTAYRYLSTRGLPGIGQDVVSMGKMVGSAVAEDPMGFAADALFAPLAAVRDVSEVRALARQAREAGDDETADQMEQLAAMSVFGAIPVAGAAVKRGVKAGMTVAKRAAAKKASLAVKPATAAAEKAPLAVRRAVNLSNVRAPNRINAQHLETVVADMKELGAPTIRVVKNPAGGYAALEGSHRLAAAKELGLKPDFQVISPKSAIHSSELPDDLTDEFWGSRFHDEQRPDSISSQDFVLPGAALQKYGAHNSTGLRYSPQDFKLAKGAGSTDKAHGGRVSSLAVKRKGKK